MTSPNKVLHRTAARYAVSELPECSEALAASRLRFQLTPTPLRNGDPILPDI